MQEDSNINIQIKENEKGRIAEIIFTKDLSLNNIEWAKQKLADHINNCNSFVINLSDMDTIDISAFQLLYSFKKSMELINKEVKIRAELNEGAQKLFTQSGLNF